MAYQRISADEAAAMIEDGAMLGVSGFTPSGNPKAFFRALSKRAVSLHEQGQPFQVSLLTGASSCQSVEGDLAAAKALRFRAPFSTNKDFRTHTNLGEIDYEDMHLGHVAERLRHGYYGKIDWAIIEVSDMVEGQDICKAFLTSAGGITATVARLARHIIIEHNTFHDPNARRLHDTYEPTDCGFGRMPIPIISPYDRVGDDFIAIEAWKIAGVIESCLPEEARSFNEPDAATAQIGHNVAELLASDLRAGRIPPQFLPIQSGVGATGNAVFKSLAASTLIPRFHVYSEVVQDAAIHYMLEGKIINASATAMTVTNERLRMVYDNIDYFSKHLTLRQSEIANSPEVIRRLGVIAVNTALECDIYGNENSSHVCGSSLMNGIGGSTDYERNGYLSIFTTPSTAKDGRISAIVPMCCHVDSTEHDVDVIVTEQGIADLRGKGPVRRAHEIIEHCAHPDYRPLLRDYLTRIAPRGHEPQSMRAALAFHDTYLRKGDMRLTDFSEYEL